MDVSLTISILTGLHVLLAVGLITLILLQQGQGAGMGAAFGSGASGTVFGSQGSGSFLTKTTAVLATVFFLNSIGLAMLASGSGGERDSSVLERVLGPEDEIPSAPPDRAAPPASDVPDVPASAAGNGDDAGEGFTDDVPAVPGSGDGRNE
ncbi:MAG: preprotein translocase subunit SecG [Gammaproteobacteria bacterium]|nr:preprotein translocase subunit SecG [Gammaproteobacteria bacterium]